MMKIKLLFTFLFLISVDALSQQNKVLEEKNGFKNIKLGDDVNNYTFLIKKDYNSDLYHKIIAGKSYTFSGTHVINVKENPDFQKIGNINVLGIFVNTIKNKIFEIIVITDYNYKLYENFLSIFGEPNFVAKGEHKDILTSWKGTNISLSISANYLVNRNQFATYYYISYTNDSLKKEYDNELHIEIEKNKKEELEKIKNDL